MNSNHSAAKFNSNPISMPAVGTALRLLVIPRFCRILGTMLANGVPLLQAQAIRRGATGSHLVADRITDAMENVRGGKTLTEPLRAAGCSPSKSSP